jgi:predicted O-linked N-acetylglucosamine transferase (SPINDLY family)
MLFSQRFAAGDRRDRTTPSGLRLPDEGFVFVVQAAPYKILPNVRSLDAPPARGGRQCAVAPHNARNIHSESARRSRPAKRARRSSSLRKSPPRYIARFRLADLYLDTYPFGSHTTVNDALFAGLPVVTLAGRSMASRTSASQLGAVGLPDLVAHTREVRAIALA